MGKYRAKGEGEATADGEENAGGGAGCMGGDRMHPRGKPVGVWAEGGQDVALRGKATGRDQGSGGGGSEMPERSAASLAFFQPAR